MADDPIDRELRQLTKEEALKRIDAIADQLVGMRDEKAIERLLYREMDEAFEDALTRFLRARQAPEPNDPDQ